MKILHTTPLLVMSGFPGVGKSTLVAARNAEIPGGAPNIWHDSDSSQFSWLKDAAGANTKTRHPEWPDNYMDHVEGLTGTVLASSHADVRQALTERNIPYSLWYPEHGLKSEYIERYRRRGSPESFVELVARMWDEWIKGCVLDHNAYRHVQLRSGEYMEQAYERTHPKAWR